MNMEGYINFSVTTEGYSSGDISGADLLYVGVKYYVYHVVLPIIFAIGMVGNALNLLVFVCRCKATNLEQLERSSMAGLISLSVSDFCFCLVGFPAAFFPESVIMIPDPTFKSIVGFHYNLYKGGLHNTFLFISTWLVVAISTERYIVVCHVLRARFLIHLKKTIAVHVVIVMIGILLCIPQFLQYRVRYNTDGNITVIYREIEASLHSPQFERAYHIIWSTIGTYIPLIILLFTNINLIMGLIFHRSLSITDPARYACSRVTKTVVCIVLTFIVLVCPSMILDSIRVSKLNTALMIAIVFLNLLQGIKFASNFVLYLAVNKRFRKNVKRAIHRDNYTSTKYIVSEQTRRTMDMEML